MLKGLSIPVLLGVLLMVALLGVASATPSARPKEQAWRVLAVSPHDCAPREETTNYLLTETYVRCHAPPCMFYCAVDFPAAGEQAVGAVNVKRVTMYAYDNTDAGKSVDLHLMKNYAPTAGNLFMATVSTLDSPSTPQAVMDTSIDNNPVYRTQAPYIWIRLEDSSFWVSGFHIHYTW